MIYPINTYAPSLIKSLGFGGYNANGLNSVGSVVSLIISISIAWNSDRTRERGFHIVVGFCVGIAGLLWTALAPVNSSKWVVYGSVSCFPFFQSPANGNRWNRPHPSWHGLDAGSQRSVAFKRRGRQEATHCVGNVCHGYPTCWFPWESTFPSARCPEI